MSDRFCTYCGVQGDLEAHCCPGVHIADLESEIELRLAQRNDSLREVEKLRTAVLWALGQNGSFATRPDGAGAYWWREELRKRAGLENK